MWRRRRGLSGLIIKRGGLSVPGKEMFIMTLGKFDILVIDIEKDKLYCRKSSCPHNKSTECMFREERPREILKN